MGVGKHAKLADDIASDLDEEAEALWVNLRALEDDLLALASRLGLDGFLRDLRATRGAS